MDSIEKALKAYKDKGFHAPEKLKTIRIYSNYTNEMLIELRVHNALHVNGGVRVVVVYNNNSVINFNVIEFPHCYYIEIEGDG